MKTEKQKETNEKEVHLLEQKGYERMVNEIVPVQQAETYRKPTQKAVKDAVKELNPDTNSLLLNSVAPTADETIRLSNEMTAEYKVPVIPVSCMELDETEIKRILAQLLFEFPIREIKVDIPKWVVKLDKDHWLKSVVFDSIKKNAAKIEKIRQIQQIISDIEQCEYITSAKVTSLDLGKGYAEMAVSIESELFYTQSGSSSELSLRIL